MHEQDEDIWNGDELQPEIRERLMRVGRPVIEEAKKTASTTQLMTSIPIYLGLLGIFFSGANVYANTMTRIATLEARIDLMAGVLTELRVDLRDLQKANDSRNQPKR